MPGIRFSLRFGSGAAVQPYVFGSFLVHAAAVVAIVLMPSLRRSPTIPEDFIAVDLAAGLPASSSSTPVTSAPTPSAPTEPAPVPEGVQLESQEPKKKPAPEKRKREPDKPRPVPPQPAAQTPAGPTGPVTDAAPGGTPGSGPSGDSSGSSISFMEGGDSEFAWYRASVTAALYSHWQRPILSRMVETVEVAVSFEIMRDGSTRNLRLDGRSGIPTLDRSALRAIQDASPLPPLPASWRAPTLSARIVFQLHPEEF